MRINSTVEARWRKEGVRFRTRPLRWLKTVRTADCALCHKHLKEAVIDQGFSGWAILAHVFDAEGKAPEVCPVCVVALSKKLTVRSPRTVQCSQCAENQKEKIYGIGFPGWSVLAGLASKSEISPPLMLCPNCSLKLARKLGGRFIRETWTDLTYPANSLLTSTKMTQNQDNFAAVAEQHTGAPLLKEPGVKNVCFGHPDQFWEGGTGTLSVGAAAASLTSSGSATKQAGIYHRHFGGIGLSFDEPITLLFRGQINHETGNTRHWAVGDGVQASDKFFGFYLNGLDMKGYNGNGTTIQETTLYSYPSGGSTMDVLKAIFTPGDKIEFYRNGVLQAISTQHLPSGALAALGFLLYFDVLNPGGGANTILHNWIVKKAVYTES